MVGVLANDSDVDSSALTAVLVQGPAHGAFSLNADGTFSYTPDANFSGTDSFTYKANDGLTDSNVATVTLNVTPVNDAPTVVAFTNATTLAGCCFTTAMFPEGRAANERESQKLRFLPISPSFFETMRIPLRQGRLLDYHEGDKEILQVAAVIGRTFSEPVLRRIAERPDAEVVASLRALCSAEFMSEEAVDPDPEYRFWHPLTQEVAYGSLLTERRYSLRQPYAG